MTSIGAKGTATLSINGAGTYDGFIQDGATASLQSSHWVQVDSGATLDLSGVTGTYTQGGGTGTHAISGVGTVSGWLTLNGNVVLSAGASSDVQNIATAGDGLWTLTFNNDLTLLGGASLLDPRAIFQLGGATGNTPDPTVAANILAFASTASAKVDHINAAGALTLHSGSVINVTLSNYTPILIIHAGCPGSNRAMNSFPAVRDA